LPEVPALPAFALQRGVSTMIRDLGHDYWTGTVYTTNRRVWEHDEDFKDYLRKLRCMAIDMETATIFSVGFANSIPSGALLLVSDQPMIPEGVKTVGARPRSSLGQALRAKLLAAWFAGGRKRRFPSLRLIDCNRLPATITR
jgi:AMP nucleosidase